MSKKLDLTVKFKGVTEAQAVALRSMFKYWEHLGGVGSSRRVAFFCDGDGNFRPKVSFESSEDILPSMIKELDELAVVEDDNGHRLYDFDSIAWKIEEDPDDHYAKLRILANRPCGMIRLIDETD